jgi:hypothetical protein
MTVIDPFQKAQFRTVWQVSDALLSREKESVFWFIPSWPAAQLIHAVWFEKATSWFQLMVSMSVEWAPVSLHKY